MSLSSVPLERLYSEQNPELFIGDPENEHPRRRPQPGGHEALVEGEEAFAGHALAQTVHSALVVQA